jgi:hypothetical protein
MSRRLFSLAALALCIVLPFGCRERRSERATPGRSASESAAQTLRAPSAPFAMSEGAPAPDPLEHVAPSEHKSQLLAFSRERLAWLHDGEVWVFGLSDMTLETRFRAPDARNVVALTGGGFLIATRDHVQRLSGAELRPELLPRVPRIGPTTIVPSRQEATQLWLHYEGIDALPRFDLGAQPLIASLPVLDWTQLYEFDRRAWLGAGDGSFVYTTADGLRRIDVEGRREPLPQPELAGRIWALAADARLDRVWAATERHLYLVHVRGHAELLARHELAPHPVALGADGGTVAVLFVEALSRSSVRLRADVYEPGAARPRVVRLVATAPAATDAGVEPALRPEVAVYAPKTLLAINAFGLHVEDYRRGVRLYPEPDGPQKLAPSAP